MPKAAVDLIKRSDKIGALTIKPVQEDLTGRAGGNGVRNG